MRKKVVWTLGALVLSAGLAAAQEKPAVKKPAPAAPAAKPAAGGDHAALDKALIANEHKMNEAVAKGDKATFSSMLASDATSADEGGFMKVSDFVPMMDQVKVADWKISDEHVTWAGANTAVVTYVWTGKGTFQGQPVPEKTYVSTVWTKKDGKWVAVYHQESAAAKPAPKK